MVNDLILLIGRCYRAAMNRWGTLLVWALAGLFAFRPEPLLAEADPSARTILALSDLYGKTPAPDDIFCRVALRLQVVAELLQKYDCFVLNRAQGFALEDEKAVHAFGATNALVAYVGAVDFAITGNIRFDARRRIEVSLHILDMSAPGTGLGTNVTWLSSSEESLPGELAQHIAERAGLPLKHTRNSAVLTNHVWAVLPMERLESAEALAKSLSSPDPLSLVAETALQKLGVAGLVERGRLEAVLQERKIQFAGGVDGMAARFGAMTGADYLLIGMTSRSSGSRLRVDMGAVAARNGVVVAARSAFCQEDQLDETVEELTRELVKSDADEAVDIPAAGKQQRVLEAEFYDEHLANHVWEPTIADEIIKTSIISAEFHLLNGEHDELQRVQRKLAEIIRTVDSYIETGFISPKLELPARVFLEQAKEAQARINTVAGIASAVRAQPRAPSPAASKANIYSTSPERRLLLKRMIYERGADYVLNTVLGANRPIIEPPGERGDRLLLYMGQPDLLWVAAHAYEQKGDSLKAARIYEGILRKKDWEITMGYLRSYVPDVAEFRKEVEAHVTRLGGHQEVWKTAAESIPANPALQIYIQPFGCVDEELIALSAKGVEDFFGLNVVVLPPVPQEGVPNNPRDPKTGEYKWIAPARWFLNRGPIPSDALAVFLLSTDAMKDIDEKTLAPEDAALGRALASGLFCTTYNRLINFSWPDKHLHISHSINYHLLHRGAELSGVEIKPCFIAPCLSSWEAWQTNPSCGICEDCQPVMKKIDLSTSFFGRYVKTQSPKEKR